MGEVDDGACGHPWHTFGHRFADGDAAAKGAGAAKGAAAAAGEDSGAGEGPGAGAEKPFEADGFRRLELPELSRLQLCKFDEPWQKKSSSASWSRTLAFRREK